MAAEELLNGSALQKHGNDAIFSWFARYKESAAKGIDAVNATVGSLLEDDGSLAINRAVDKAIRASPALEFSAYAPLKGLPNFLDLSKSLALGPSREPLEDSDISMTSIATPGGSGALYLSAANLIEKGQSVLLRDRHWAPYRGFLAGCDLEWRSWSLLPEGNSQYPYFHLKDFEDNLKSLAENQSKVLIWLNDPAHNPTGLSMTPEGRQACLDAVITSALNHEDVGHTLLIDAAYAMYADDPHGWGETLISMLNSGAPWPENMLICFAVSLSKSHTIYGLRTGALVSLHPNKEVTEKLSAVYGVTGRSTWSAAPRIAQYTVSELHSSAEKGEAWGMEIDRFKSLLDSRRTELLNSCKEFGIDLNPTHDGFFAWFECSNPVEIAERCAEKHVYVVPLEGGIRIGLCAMNISSCKRVASALAEAVR